MTDPIVDETGEAPLWTCPSCGHRFVTRNLWHSCSRHDLDELFARAEPQVRGLFDRWGRSRRTRRADRRDSSEDPDRVHGPDAVRGAQVRRDRLIANIALPRRVQHPRWTRIEAYGPRWIAHRFDIRRPEDLDDPELAALACESRRELGEQASLRRAIAT